MLAVLMLGERMNRGRVVMLFLGFAGVLVILRPGFAIVQPAALLGWTAPELRDLPWIAVIGCGSFTAHYCLTRAMKFADAMVVVPLDFFRLPLIAVVGAVFYAEPFDPAVILGAVLIFAGTWFSLSREGWR